VNQGKRLRVLGNGFHTRKLLSTTTKPDMSEWIPAPLNLLDGNPFEYSEHAISSVSGTEAFFFFFFFGSRDLRAASNLSTKTHGRREAAGFSLWGSGLERSQVGWV
jgi:hypothetical protein